MGGFDDSQQQINYIRRFFLTAQTTDLAIIDPEIFNTDQGAKFTSEALTDMLKAAGIRISLDGKGRWVDNVYVERLWSSLKFEEVHLNTYEALAEARQGMGSYFRFYNRERRHQGLDRQTSDQVYEGSGTWPVTE